MIGKSLAHYEITALLGRGGMGEVYRARDTRLGRDVAIKSITGDLAADAERLARFRREARTLASLSHPHIASIFGIEEADGQHFLVMELVEGEDLLERLRRGPLGVDDALEVAEAIAIALEAAHEQGIIHRDLKPANVKLGDHVKLLDFGLARAALDGDASDPATSPTVTAAFTQAGTILGTAAYMAPEQARGKVVDRRADIWAFGVVLWEMLTGRRLFEGETVSDTLASVIKDDLDLEALPAETPPVVRALIARCLERDPKRRLQSMGEARIALEAARRGESSALLSGLEVSADADDPTPTRRTSATAWIVALIAVAALGVGLGTRLGDADAPPRLRMFDLVPPGLQIGYPRHATLSPDGRRLAYFADDGLRIRDLHALESIVVPDADLANAPFWSPDGQWLGFGALGRIFKVPATGGRPEIVCNVDFSNLDGAVWGDDGWMVLAPDTGPLQRVGENGGDPVDVFPLRGSESDYHTPTLLPDGRGILYTVHQAAGRETLEVFADGQRKQVLRIPGARLEYATYAPHPRGDGRGMIVYHRLQTNPGVYAVPFELETLEVVGEPVLLDAAGSYPSLADDGSMLYARHAASLEGRFAIVDATGALVRTVGEPLDSFGRFSVAPNGRNLLVEADGDIWLIDLERGTQRRLTFQTGVESHPEWIGDGSRFAYTVRSAGQLPQTFVGPVDGSSPPEPFVRGIGLSSDRAGENFTYDRFSPGSILDLYRKSADVADTGRIFLRTPRLEQGAKLSPDGRFVAFMSDISGTNEVYLRTYPEGDGQWQVSVGGGAWPRWAKDGSYILFRQRSGAAARMIRTPVTLSPTVSIGAAEVLFNADARPGLLYVSGFSAYDTTDDPDRFVMIAEERHRGSEHTRLVFVEDLWAAFELD